MTRPAAAMGTEPTREYRGRQIDTDQVRSEHPVIDVVASYGIELRQAGSALVGRCPFHADAGRPNLHIYGRSARWICYRCQARGDVIGFVQQIEHLSFLQAVERLEGPLPSRTLARCPPPVRRRPDSPRQVVAPGPEEQEVMAAAVELYANRLLTDSAALAYMAARGFPPGLLERYRVGFAAGDTLTSYLRWRRLPLSAAVRAGLFTTGGRELLAGRIVLPEIRAGQPVWLIGRQIDCPVAQPGKTVVKYLGLPGPKPLIGWEEAMRDPRAVYVVEGPLDWLALRAWGVPAVALAGCYVRPEIISSLGHFGRIYLALDQDAGGDLGAQKLAQALGPKAVRLKLPDDIKDVAQLAQRPDGEELFRVAQRTAGGLPSGGEADLCHAGYA